MRAGPIALALAAILVSPPIARADWYDGEYQDCGERNGTMEIVECVVELHAKWDARLNAAYRSAIELEQESRRTAFRDVQRAWIAYRDANCAYYWSGEGSKAAIEGNTCMFALTRDRALELEMLVPR